MDRTVPPGAARLLDFIRATEVGTVARSGYDVIYGHNQDKLPKPVTSMTVDEVLAQQTSWTRMFRSSATGGYQFMRNTLQGLKAELGLRGEQVLDPDLQDRLGYHLLKRRGYDKFVGGVITQTEFGKRLAQEWASFPVLSATRGATRDLTRGQSYYAGDGLNKALVQPSKVEAILQEVMSLSKAPMLATAPAAETPPVPEPKPEMDAPIIVEAPAPILPVPVPALPPVPVGLPAIVGSVNKAVGAARGAAKGAALGPAIALIAPKFGIFPEWIFEPAYQAAFLLIGGVVIAGGWAFISTYRAPANE